MASQVYLLCSVVVMLGGGGIYFLNGGKENV